MLINESGKGKPLATDDDHVEYRNVNGHVEIYINGKWAGSADTKGEARKIVAGEDED